MRWVKLPHSGRQCQGHEWPLVKAAWRGDGKEAGKAGWAPERSKGGKIERAR